jgi:diguanylate cyclase (GGDEF)-like protein/PAS domain S-box-containing protein
VADDGSAQVNRLLRALSAIRKVLLRERDPDRMLAETCRILVDQGQFAMVWVGIADFTDGSVQPRACAGTDLQSLQALEVRCDTSPLGQGPTGTAIRTGHHIICGEPDDNLNDARWSNVPANTAFRCCAAFPLRVAQTVVGAINLCTREANAFTKTVVEALDELTADIGLALRNVEDALETARGDALLKAITEQSFEGIVLLDNAGRFVLVNPKFCEIAGYSAAELKRMSVPSLLPPNVTPQLFYRALENESGVREVELVRSGGNRVAVEISVAPVETTAEKLVLGIVRDVSARRRAQATMRQLSQAIEQSADTVLISNYEGIIEYVNPAFETVTGYSLADVMGKTPRIVKSGRHDGAFYRHMWTTIRSGHSFEHVFVNKRKDGSLYYEEKTITPLRSSAGQITHFVATGKDITDRMHTQERLEFLAHHDPLTQLPNRSLFLDRLDRALARAAWHERLVGIMYIDLDRFKNINDTLGHDAGDEVLQSLTKRLLARVRDGDTVARLGGDEFALLLDDIASSRDIVAIAKNLLETIQTPFTVGSQQFFLTASIGISLFPHDGSDPRALLKHADVAMYRAKELGKNTYQFYSAEMGARAFERLTLESSLRHAITEHQFTLHYQPQVDARSGKIVGAEALLRWQHPDFGLVSPAAFIPLLEETGLITTVGEWVLDTACHHAREWHGAGHEKLSVSVNVSARQFNHPTFRQRCSEIIKASGVDPAQVEFELTESAIMVDDRYTQETLRSLASIGSRIALDDFGTGYSSLTHLQRFSIDTLKIDRSFVQDLPNDGDDAAIIAAIIGLARGLGLNLVAEGVERDDQRAFLLAHDCAVMQGYYFSPAVPYAAFMALLRKQDAGAEPD